LVFGEELGLDRRGNFTLAVEGPPGSKTDEKKGQGDDAKEDEKKRGQTSDDQLEHAWRVGKSARGGKEKYAGAGRGVFKR
jgi:hypothetical protein